ncbi:hypothetical protein [Nocardia sp. NPDC004711]
MTTNTDQAIAAVGREWLYQCADAEARDAEDAKHNTRLVKGLSDARVRELVARDWGGGMRAFMNECATEIAEQQAKFDRDRETADADRRAREVRDREQARVRQVDAHERGPRKG